MEGCGSDLDNKMIIQPNPSRGIIVVWAKDEFCALYVLEFVTTDWRLEIGVAHTGVGRRKDALIIGDNSCSAFLLCIPMISPTRLPRVMGYVGNMPKRGIYFGFLDSGDTKDTKSSN